MPPKTAGAGGTAAAEPAAAPAVGARRTRLTAEQRRESIIEAAAAVFGEVGYQRGKTSEVAARVGVTEPVVFQNFGSKAALYAIVVERAALELAESVAAVVHGKVSTHLAHLLSPPHMAALHAPGSAGFLFADAMTLSEPEIEQAARHGVNALAAAVTVTLRQGQSDGDIRADLDPEAAAWWVLSLLASHRFRETVMPADPALHARVDDLVIRTLTG